jgi:3-isopropylmalate dehydratase small subunit
LGLAAVVSPEAAAAYFAGDEIEIDLIAGKIHDLTQDRIFPSAPLDPRAAELLAAGGLVPYLKAKYQRQRRDSCLTTV